MLGKKPFNKIEEQLILSAIKAAENNTSGEIRLHIEPRCKTDDTYERAIDLFEELGMTETKDRNGVLIYMAIDDKKFAIIGDEGINDVVPENFWNNTKDLMIEQFKQGKIAQGLVAGIHDAGEQLKAFFPYQKDDTNELSDDISYGS
ncbi:MAG: TPM domain-containing protein [Salibacteraceae bacterium]|nr:TPM domain-containing protein [Salibacteraceae bacterium]